MHKQPALSLRDCLLGCWWLVCTAAAAVAADDIGSAKQLFIDDHIVASLGGSQRVFKQPIKTEPLLSASQPWETKRSLAYPTVRRESAGSWKMWYRSGTPAGERTINYATSQEGIHWTKPSLGIYPHHEGKNNIVLIGTETFVDTPSIFKEDDAYYLYCSEGDVRYVTYHSADGIHRWSKTEQSVHADHRRVVQSGTPTAASHNYDICLAAYDPYARNYILHFKVAQKQPLFGPNDWQRIFYQHRYTGSLGNIQQTPFPLLQPRVELADAADVALEPGTLRCENYGLGMYPQEDGSVIGFSWLFSIDGHNGRPSAGGDGTSDGFWHYGPLNVMLVYSRDIDGPWQRPTRTPILARGSSGSWDDGMVHTANAPVEVPRSETGGATTDQVWMYYGGANHLHNRNPATGERDHQFAIAKWRIDGFAALEDTDGKPDTVTSKPITFSGIQLTLNADVQPGGSITVRIRSSSGRELRGDSDPVVGDHQRHIVRWNDDDNVGHFAGEPVVIQWTLKNAALYSFDFSDGQ